MSLDKITWLNPGLKLTIFRGTGPRAYTQHCSPVLVHHPNLLLPVSVLYLRTWPVIIN